MARDEVPWDKEGVERLERRGEMQHVLIFWQHNRLVDRLYVGKRKEF